MISIYYSPKYERTALVYYIRVGFLCLETEDDKFELSSIQLEKLLLEKNYYLVGFL